MDMTTLTSFFGWMAVINMGVLLVGTVMSVAVRDSVSRIHAKIFGIDPADISRMYFQWVAQYKIGAFIFSIVPWIALQLMA